MRFISIVLFAVIGVGALLYTIASDGARVRDYNAALAAARADAEEGLPYPAVQDYTRALNIYNSDAAVLGVSMKDGAKTLTLTEESVRLHPHNKEVLDVKKKVVAQVPLKKDRIWLRIDADFRPGETRDIAKLWYSLDGKEWNRIGEDYRMRFDWQRFFMGTKFAIFNYATEEAGGYVDVDYFDYRKINN